MRFSFHKIYFLAIIFFSTQIGSLYAQRTSDKIDSLKLEIVQAKSDTDRVKFLVMLSRAFRRADTSQQLKYGNDALQLAEKNNWVKGMTIANIAIGGFYSETNLNYRAVQFYERADSLSRITGDKLDMSDALNYMGDLYVKMAQYGKSLDNYREALALNPDPVFAMGIYGNMGDVYNRIGDYPHALRYFDSSLLMLDATIRVRKKSSGVDTLQRAGLLMAIADVYIAMQQYDNALDNYNSALALIKRTKWEKPACTALAGIGKAYMCKNEPGKAIEYYTMAVDIGKKNHKYITDILNKLGDAYLAKGDILKAMECARHALLSARQNVEDTSEVPRVYTTIGKISCAQKNYVQAVIYLQDAIDICRQSGALNDEKEAWEALSSTYEKMNKPALALSAYKRYISLRDSVYNVDKAKELVRQDMKTKYGIDSLKQDESKKLIMLSLQRQRAISYGGIAALVLVLLLSFFIYRNYSQQKKANIQISIAHEKISDEKQKSETLLLNILPEEVAKELKEFGDVRPKLFENVTVLFTDFVDFTVAGDRLSPQQLIAELHSCFKIFDAILGKYNIEKIKTVGDAYIAVAGLPEPNANHAVDVVNAALEIRDFMLERRKELNENTFLVRIGVNSGPVIAGIVGAKKFAYDIWGDTVNVAARMEQNSDKGMVNVSEKTYLLVKDKFNCTDRGKFPIKNKGEMNMYFAERKNI